ncbi:unnamed protein product, partial [Hapterophycus canaliculatus]
RGGNHRLATVAGDLEGIVHAWDKTRGAMDCSVDETLRSVSYSVAKSRVMEKLVGMGAEVVDGAVPNKTKPSRRPSRGKHRGRSHPPPPALLSPPSPQAQSPSPSASLGVPGRGGGGGDGHGGSLDAHRVGGGDGALGYPQPLAEVAGFDLRAALESTDIRETRGHVRALYDLAAQQELMLDELNRAGMFAIDLNHRLSLKLLDK